MLKEYTVIARDFYREHEPEIYNTLATNKEDAMDIIFRKDSIKEILDVMLSDEINWNEEIKINYWLMYADIETINMFK